MDAQESGPREENSSRQPKSPASDKSIKDSIFNLQETERYLRGESQGVFVVVWKQPPTLEALDQALAPLVAKLRKSRDISLSFIIVNKSANAISEDTNKYAKDIIKEFAQQLRPLAIVDLMQGPMTTVNRIALRMLLITAGFFGLGPTMAFFKTCPEAGRWVAEKRQEYGDPIKLHSLNDMIDWMVTKCAN